MKWPYLFGILLAGTLAAQQQQWQIPSPPSWDTYHFISPFGDCNQDGCRDILVGLTLNDTLPNATPGHRIVSGRDGSTLWERADLMAGRMTWGGDIDQDGVEDVIMWHGIAWNGVYLGRAIQAWSVGKECWLWQVIGPDWLEFGQAMLGNLDLDADGFPDFVTLTASSWGSDVYAYDHQGQLLYTIPCLSANRVARSLAKMGDMDGDGCDEFVVGCEDSTLRGVVLLVSGQTGAIIRQSFGLLPGDIIAAHASNLGDIDGDGVNDYAGFPWWSASRAMVTAFSGQTGAVIRTWATYANSAITGEDVDLDGVPDLVTGADYLISQNVRGRTVALSGRDGTELWRVENFAAPPGSGSFNGSSGWMEYSTSIGVPSGEHYPAIAWLDLHWFVPGTLVGRVRGFSPARAGQGPITGTPCSTSSELPLIGTRQTAIGARVTVAKSHPGALAWLNLSLASDSSYVGVPLPFDLSAFGLTGCQLYVAPIANYLRTLGTAGIDRGYAAVDLPFSLTSSGVGVPLAAQWLVFDPATLAYAATARHEIRGL